MDDLGAALARDLAYGVDRAAHEQHLAGQVGVMGSRGRARPDER